MEENFILPANCKLECYKFDDSGWEIVPANVRRTWIDETHGQASKCLPLLAANQMGYTILSPTDFAVVWSGKPQTDSLKIIVEDDKFAHHIVSHFGHGIFTFKLPYIFRTSPEIGLFVRGATNFWVDGAVALDGFVETNWSNYSFTMNWKTITQNKVISFNKGEPICMIVPYPTRLLENLEVKYAPFKDASDEMKRIHSEWSAYRNNFNNRKDRKSGDWQKDYFVGRKCPFSGDSPENKGCPHRTKFKLPRFDT